MKIKSLYIIIGCILLIVTVGLLGCYDRLGHEEKVTSQDYVHLLRKNLDKAFVEDNFEWPSKIVDGDSEYDLEYAFNQDLVDYSEKLLRRNSGDYTSITIIDNNNGEIILSTGFSRKEREFRNYLPFTSTHPSASLFKIIAAADLIRSGSVDENTVFQYQGRGTTLYRYQLGENRKGRINTISLKKAFALSNNVVFGKAAIERSTGHSIFKTATDFGFNRDLMNEITLPKSIFMMPEDQYNLAEMASGFNKQTLISPIHGALMASVVANNGVLKTPKLIRRLTNSVDGQVVWENEMRKVRVLEPNTSIKLQEMMEYAASSGTARSLHRRIQRHIKNGLDIGAKTGSITGGLPYGKRDWLTLYVMPKNISEDLGISICIMNINIKNWYVKSTYLAKKLIEYYYGKLHPIE